MIKNGILSMTPESLVVVESSDQTRKLLQESTPHIEVFLLFLI